MKNMSELKLRPLYRGFVLTDFNGNEVGCKDLEHVIEEIKKLLKLDEESEKSIEVEHSRKSRISAVELHRNIFEKAKEQISMTGKVNGAQIGRELCANVSNIHNHLKKMDNELQELIKKWQDEEGKKLPKVEIREK
jgi:DNA-binding transcriptional MerR regulator